MRIEKARIGARGTDSVQSLTWSSAAALKAAGIDYVVRYLGSITHQELEAILGAGLGFMPVTFADNFDGAATVRACNVLQLPPGTTVWLDLENSQESPENQIQLINAWADAVKAAGWEPGLYIGSPQQLTGPELTALHVVRYWKAPSRVVDRHGTLTEPAPGYCMLQLWPSVMWAGVWVDVDVVQQDYLGRVPTWCVA